MSDEIIMPIPQDDGKAQVIPTYIKAVPLIVGGNSRGDMDMLNESRGLKIVVGTVPVFIMAGFIEGFLTRHTQLPDMLRLGLILTSLTFILFYYIYLPNRKRHGITKA